MSLPSRKKLLERLDPLPHGERLALLAQLGRAHRETPALRALTRELLGGDSPDAHLALQLAMSSRDEAALFAALAHPAVSVQAVAARWVSHRGSSEDAIVEAVASATPATRRRLLKGLALARRSAPAERLFERTYRDHGPGEAALLLPALSPARQAEVLPDVAHTLSVWHTLGLRQPDTVLAFLSRELRRAPEAERPRLFARYATALGALTLRRAGPLLALTNETAPPDLLPDFLDGVLPRLLRQHPEATLALLLRPGVHHALPRFLGRAGALRALSRVPPAQRLEVARALADRPPLLARLLAAMPPAQRPALLAHAWAEARPVPAPLDVLETLPGEARDAQALAELSLRQVRESEPLRLAVLALRAPRAALEPLLSATRAAKAEDRAAAWTHVIACVGRDRGPLELLFGPLERLRNEQDPVRQAALSALAALPLSLFRPGHIAGLESQVTWATEARDASHATHTSLQTLALRLLRAQAATPEAPLFGFALWTLERVAGQSGQLQLPALDRNLPRGAEHHLVAALLPRLRDAVARENHLLPLSLAVALGRRAWNVERLQALLEPATSARPDWVAQRAIGLWLAPPRTRDARVRRLLDRDPSAAVLPEVFGHLHRRRQDWLDPLLADAPLRGRFSTGKTLWLAPVQTGLFRWLPRQQERLRARQLRVASDPKRSSFERAGALGSLACAPTARLEHLRPFVADPEVPVSEAALTALAWLEEPADGLPVLLDHLEGDRARVAAYALARVARLSPTPITTAALEGLLARERLKITVHKEALRLLGAFPSERSLPLLRAQLERERLHPDVRIAVGHALRRLLGQEEAWTLLAPLAADARPDVAASLLDASPESLAPLHRPRYGELLLTVARHPEARVRTAAWDRLGPWSSGIERQVASAAAACVLALDGAPEWATALRVLSGLTFHEAAAADLVACARSLLTASASEPAETTPERDLPASQRLDALVEVLRGWPRSQRLSRGAVLERVAAVAGSDPAWWSEHASLRLAALDFRDATAATRLVEQLTTQLDVDPLRQAALCTNLSAELATLGVEQDPSSLLSLVDALEPRAPLGALSVLEHLGRRLHWSPASTERLRRLRRSPLPSVRNRARRIVTAAE